MKQNYDCPVNDCPGYMDLILDENVRRCTECGHEEQERPVVKINKIAKFDSKLTPMCPRCNKALKINKDGYLSKCMVCAQAKRKGKPEIKARMENDKDLEKANKLRLEAEEELKKVHAEIAEIEKDIRYLDGESRKLKNTIWLAKLALEVNGVG